MSFSNLAFPFGAIAVVFFYWIIKKAWRAGYLLVISYLFYCLYSPKYAILLAVMTAVAYFCGQLLNRRQSRLLLAGGIICSFLPLALLKGISFFPSVRDLYSIVIPMGLSYYSFKTVGYLVDVYKKKVDAEKNLVSFALFVSFFPELLVGPIDRAENLLTQINRPCDFSWKEVKRGVLFAAFGYMQKMVIADRIGMYVNAVYADPGTYTGVYTWAAVLLYSMQIYMDFAGCTNIARGLGMMMGYRLPYNFKQPYLSTSVAEFWRGWHMSLTGWFRDYVYIPLGGNRRGAVRKVINTMIVFGLSGLWHGNSVSFVVWGLLNGLFVVIGNGTRKIRDRIWKALHVDVRRLEFRVLRGAGTYLLISFAWIFFRADGMRQAFLLLRGMAAAPDGYILFGSGLYSFVFDAKNWYLLLIGLLVILAVSIMEKRGLQLDEMILNRPFATQLLVLYVLIFASVLMGVYGTAYNAENFIYMNF
jgi:D-alanyl-lipoteichoic acid acyltransferase DltB (MBOAT superfamily)